MKRRTYLSRNFRMRQKNFDGDGNDKFVADLLSLPLSLPHSPRPPQNKYGRNMQKYGNYRSSLSYGAGGCAAAKTDLPTFIIQTDPSLRRVSAAATPPPPQWLMWLDNVRRTANEKKANAGSNMADNWVHNVGTYFTCTPPLPSSPPPFRYTDTHTQCEHLPQISHGYISIHRNRLVH